MTYVKLIAKPDTWFKEGSEVYAYDCNPPEDLRRITYAEWEEMQLGWDPRSFVVLARGIRVVEAGYEEALFGPPGTERWDGESCGSDEFEVTYVEESC
jgi:hypothetical protein